MMFSDGVYRVSRYVSVPRRVSAPSEPAYTKEALEATIEGKVELYATIEEDGVPRDLRVIGSLHPGLDQNALDCVSAWRFRPGRKSAEPRSRESDADDESGEAVAVAAHIEVHFQLPGGAGREGKV